MMLSRRSSWIVPSTLRSGREPAGSGPSMITSTPTVPPTDAGFLRRQLRVDPFAHDFEAAFLGREPVLQVGLEGALTLHGELRDEPLLVQCLVRFEVEGRLPVLSVDTGGRGFLAEKRAL